MLRKKIALLFLTVAYAILLGHNIIPHHHHEHDHEANEHHAVAHHHHSHEHESDTEEEGLNNLFSLFLHASGELSFTIHHSPLTFSKRLTSYVAVLPGNFSLHNFLIPPLLHNSFAEQVIYISPHSLPSGLRAPPAV